MLKKPARYKHYFTAFDNKCKDHEFPEVGDEWTYNSLGSDESYRLSLYLPLYDCDVPQSKNEQCVWCFCENTGNVSQSDINEINFIAKYKIRSVARDWRPNRYNSRHAEPRRMIDTRYIPIR